ncbi:hypothetical protein CERSUDRAFT_118506, partial [Gelatoporia subvermispora B]
MIYSKRAKASNEGQSSAGPARCPSHLASPMKRSCESEKRTACVSPPSSRGRYSTRMNESPPSGRSPVRRRTVARMKRWATPPLVDLSLWYSAMRVTGVGCSEGFVWTARANSVVETCGRRRAVS